MFRWTAVFLCALSVVISRADDTVSIPSDPGSFHLFLLVGQSNMAGRGKVEAEDLAKDKRVLMLNKKGEWVPAVDPMHFDKPIAGVGLGKTFGLDVAKANEDIVVGLIPCAVGGSPISTWEPGEFYRPTKSHPYDDAMRRARLSLESGVLKGILWHQGESDSKPKLCDVYESKLHSLIHRFRSELDAPDAVFIAGGMGEFTSRPWSEEKRTVDAVHRSLPEKIERSGFVDARDLNHKGDHVHFDSKSYRTLGHRYAKKYRELTKAKD